MEEQAHTLVIQAKTQVERMMAQANQEVANWVSEAAAQGAEQGGTQATQLREKLKQLQELMQKELDANLLRAAFETAKEVLTTEVTSSPTGIIQIIQTALKTAPEISQISLRVNPEDATVIRSQKQAILDTLERAKDFDIREDKQVERGGVLIHTEAGIIDAQLSTQLEEIARVLGV